MQVSTLRGIDQVYLHFEGSQNEFEKYLNDLENRIVLWIKSKISSNI